MLPITQFPRRFTTAHKRMLLAASQAAVAPSSVASASARVPSSRLAATLTTLAGSNPFPSSSSSPSSSTTVSSAVRSVPTRAASTQSSPPLAQSFGAAAASAVDELDDSYLYGERDDDWFTTDRDPRSDASFPGRDPVSGRLHSIAMPNLATCTRASLLDYLDNTWALSDALFATLQGEHAFVTPPPHHLRHPLIFYYGHPTCFYVNKLVVAGLLPRSLNPYFEQVFEVGVDEMRWDDMSKNEMQWPSVAEVTAYRRQVYLLVKQLIETHPALEDGHAPVDESSQLWALAMALEHDRIHLETSSMLMLEHPVDFFVKSDLLADYHPTAYRPTSARHPTAGVDYPVNELLPVPATSVTVGKSRGFPSFGWDNEYGSKTISVPACEASKYMISNGEFFEFVASGGYLEPSFWSPHGWEWRCFRNTKWPQFWVPDGPSGSHQYKLRALFDVLPMQWDWPAQVNFHEAQAFCKWKNAGDDSVVYHLTTEPVHHILRDAKDRATHDSDDVLTVRATMARDHGKNLNFSHASFSPVDAMAPTASGFHDVFGNAWEWCEDVFSALPGFKLHKYYDDFSAPCFDGEHQVIMGGSFMSTGDNGASKFARYHFRPHFFQHAGFRVVAQPVDATTQSYTLATTCVNAPGPHATASSPYRTTDVVVINKDAAQANGQTYDALFDEIYRKSESALERFMQSLGDTSKTMLVRNGADGAAKLQDQLKRGDVMVVVSDSGEQLQLERFGYTLVQTGAVPIFTKHSDTEARVAVRTASAWRKQ